MLHHALFFMYGLTQHKQSEEEPDVKDPEEDEKKDLTFFEKHYINMFKD